MPGINVTTGFFGGATLDGRDAVLDRECPTVDAGREGNSGLVELQVHKVAATFWDRLERTKVPVSLIDTRQESSPFLVETLYGS